MVWPHFYEAFLFANVNVRPDEPTPALYLAFSLPAISSPSSKN